MLSIDDISIRIAGRLLLDQASARITPGSRVGLVGRNGTGKSTLFNAITRDLSVEQGKIELPSRWRIGRLAQEAPNGPESLLDVVLMGDTERTELLAEAETATDPQRIADIQTRLADIDAYSAPARAATILSGLGFSTADQARPCTEFSGGWRMRVALAAVLFAEPDLLLLDEPTNYLDLEGTLWLQDHLAKYQKTLIVISHDRDLLDTSVNFILSLEHSKLTLYRGGYSAFEKLRAERQLLDQKMVKKQEEKRKHMQAFVDRFRAKATKARQAQSRLKMLEKLDPITALVTSDVRPIEIPHPERLPSPPIIALDRVAVGYEPGRPVLSRLSMRIDNDDRIALLGSNGNGKSTLVKLIAGKLDPFDGSVTRAQKLKIAYFAQHQLDELHENESPYDHVRALMPDAPEARIRARVGAIGFSGEAADTKVARLSGGEKARLMLALATFDAPHLLILDEPTNHLDIDSRSALIEAINDFPGATLLVSHDRHLLDACADRLWLVADGEVNAFDGDLNDYRRRVLSERSDDGTDKTQKPKQEKSTQVEQRRNSAERRAATAQLRQRVTKAQSDIDKLSKTIERLDGELADGTLFTRDPGKAAALAKQRADAAASLASAEEEWLSASAEYEEANA
jgi:ATP-binding cassette subfamily F protein 3